MLSGGKEEPEQKGRVGPEQEIIEGSIATDLSIGEPEAAQVFAFREQEQRRAISESPDARAKLLQQALDLGDARIQAIKAEERKKNAEAAKEEALVKKVAEDTREVTLRINEEEKVRKERRGNQRFLRFLGRVVALVLVVYLGFELYDYILERDPFEWQPVMHATVAVLGFIAGSDVAASASRKLGGS